MKKVCKTCRHLEAPDDQEPCRSCSKRIKSNEKLIRVYDNWEKR